MSHFAVSFDGAVLSLGRTMPVGYHLLPQELERSDFTACRGIAERHGNVEPMKRLVRRVGCGVALCGVMWCGMVWYGMVSARVSYEYFIT